MRSWEEFFQDTANATEGKLREIKSLSDDWEDCGIEDCTDGCWFVRRLKNILDR